MGAGTLLMMTEGSILLSPSGQVCFLFSTPYFLLQPPEEAVCSRGKGTLESAPVGANKGPGLLGAPGHTGLTEGHHAPPSHRLEHL